MRRVIVGWALALAICVAFGCGVALSVLATQSTGIFPAATVPAILALAGGAAWLIAKVVI